MMKLTQINHIPDGFLDLENPTQLHTVVDGPTLMHLEGRRQEPLFVSILLHGNEDTGFYALQKLLKKYQNHPLPRSLSVFFGNVEAASSELRRMPGQPDFNRVWPTTSLDDSPETRVMAEITHIMASRNPFASIDVHNNTGLNPHYGCINKLEPAFLHLSALFSRTVVFFENPTGVQAMAMAPYCPAVTIECGKSHLPHGIEHAFEYLDAILNLAEIPDHPVHHQDVDVYHTVARVQIPEGIDFSFSDRNASLQLWPEIEKYNFAELEAGAVFGEVKEGEQIQLEAWDDAQNDLGEKYFHTDHGRLTLNKAAMPSMLTLDEKVIRQDCLCYLMERIALPEDVVV